MIELGRDPFISFDEEAHTYLGKDGNFYEPVSRVLDHVKAPFNTEMMSFNSAKKRLEDASLGTTVTRDEILLEQDKLKREWKEAAVESQNHGNNIHKYLEDYFNMKRVDDTSPMYKIALQLRNYYARIGYYVAFNEVRTYSKKHLVCGTSDRCQLRTQRTKVVDWFDYKTNLRRGIEFDSAKRDPDTGVVKFYNKYMLAPLEHLEDCNYVRYSLQLSIYALMAELTYGVKTGRLAIVYIPPSFSKAIIYPALYLRSEAMLLLELNITKKVIPEYAKVADSKDFLNKEKLNSDYIPEDEDEEW